MASQNLTTLARYLISQPIANISASQSAQINQLIGSASRAILGELNRSSIINQQYTERYDGLGFGNSRMLLRKYPVTSVTAVLIGSCSIPAALPPSTTGPAPKGYLIQPWDGLPPGQIQGLDFYCYDLWQGSQNVSVTYNAGYMVSGEAATLAATSYTPLAPYGMWAADNGVSYATSGVALTPVAASPLQGQYIPPNPFNASPTYTYTFNALDEGVGLLFNYSYIPSDLEQACIAWVAERVAYAGRVGLRSQSLAQQETFSYFLGKMPDYVMAMIEPYINVVPIA